MDTKTLEDLVRNTVHRIDKIAVVIERLETVTSRHTRQLHGLMYDGRKE